MKNGRRPTVGASSGRNPAGRDLAGRNPARRRIAHLPLLIIIITLLTPACSLDPKVIPLLGTVIVPTATPTLGPTNTPAPTNTPLPTVAWPTPIPSAPADPATPATSPPPGVEALGGMIAGPASDAERQAADALANTDYPPADFVALAGSLGGFPGEIPRVVAAEPFPWKVGDQAPFWVLNIDTIEFTAAPMQLRAIGEHAYLWFDLEGPSVSDADAQKAADAFDDIYERDRAIFGEEPNPGIDGDPRIYILHTVSRRMGSSVAGYQDDTSQLPRAAFAHSNEHELFVMNVEYLPPGSEAYADTLAREFQHMIHGNYDPNDEDWVVEGSAVYAEGALGFTDNPEYFASPFLANPDAQLNTWSRQGSSDYGKGFLFVRYVADRFGQSFVRDWLQRPENGLRGLDAALQAAGQSVGAAEVFEGWVVANLIGNNSRAPQEYRYGDLDFTPVQPASLGPLPYEQTTTVSQYAADYYSLNGASDRRVEFSGSAKVRPIPAGPHSGERYWWSGRANQSDLRLTREIDLSGVSSARLHYWVWHEIEEGWDYGYVVVSTDGGATWRGLATANMSDYDPQNKAYTNRFYTGDSEGEWLEESADLTPFAGQKILLRFEYITDAILTESGLAIDDLAVPEVNYFDDAEVNAGWQSAGFNLVTAYLPQEWSLQLVTDAGGTPKVQAIELADGTSASFDVPANSDAVLIISALAPATLEPATYTLTVK